MNWEIFNTWPNYIAWTGTAVCWLIAAYSIYMYRRNSKRQAAVWDRMFAQLSKDIDLYMKLAQESMAYKRELEEHAWKLAAVRMYLQKEMDRRQIPYPEGFDADTTLH